MTEPAFVRASSDLKTQDERWAWMMTVSEEGARAGCAYFTVDFDRKTGECVMRGWLKKPEEKNEWEIDWG